MKARDVNRTRISRVPKIFPVPGKKISRTNFREIDVYCVHGAITSGDLINVRGCVV